MQPLRQVQSLLPVSQYPVGQLENHPVESLKQLLEIEFSSCAGLLPDGYPVCYDAFFSVTGKSHIVRIHGHLRATPSNEEVALGIGFCLFRQSGSRKVP